jgi:hypothetical protein
MNEINPAERLTGLERRREQLEQRRSKIAFEIGEIDADIAALRRVVDRCLLAAEGEEPTDADGRQGEVKEAVLMAIPHATSPFNATAIISIIKELVGTEFEAGPVSTCLRRLAGDGTIVEQDKGQGRRQTTYRHKNSTGEVAA